MILHPTTSPESWRSLLADPTKHWRRGFSAMSLAYCWEEAHGFPKSVRQALATQPALQDLELLLAIPEHKVDLPGGKAASQNDLFVLARSSSGLVAIMVEGKVSEPFGPLVSDWMAGASPGKIERLRFLCQILGTSEAQVQDIRYQFLHRTASAIIEAGRFTAICAVMLVHSFSKTCDRFGDFRQFSNLFGLNLDPNQIGYSGGRNGIELYLGWVSDTGDYGPERAAASPVSGTIVARKCPHCGHHEIEMETSGHTFLPMRPGDKVQLIRGDDNDAID